MNKFICLVGMCGSGKSVLADALVAKNYLFFRFGQITMDLIKERGLAVSEENERAIREQIRKEHGMGAYAFLNRDKIKVLLQQGNVVGDGLYSWSEYKILKQELGAQLIVIAVYSPPHLRYQRLIHRKQDGQRSALRNRPLTEEQAKARDYAEIENIEKGGPIAMADYTLMNTGTISDLLRQFQLVMAEIESTNLLQS